MEKNIIRVVRKTNTALIVMKCIMINPIPSREMVWVERESRVAIGGEEEKKRAISSSSRGERVFRTRRKKSYVFSLFSF